jgi:hypothetical protein
MDHLEHEVEDLKKSSLMSKRAVFIDLLAGTVAGITSTYAGYPLDLIKFRLQIAPNDTLK